MMFRRNLSAVLCVWLIGSPVGAEVTPTSLGGDPRIQAVQYDPQEVVALSVTAGFSATVIFSPDERIETVTVGDSASWKVQVNHRADVLVVKPVGYPSATNLTVLSDQRVYNFILTVTSPGDSVQPYLLRFTYAVPESPQAPEIDASPASYRLHGSRALRPEAMSDDGEFTSIVWPANTAMPAVYRVEETGHMALINGIIRDGAFVIEGVFPRLIFIRGRHRTSATRFVEHDKP